MNDPELISHIEELGLSNKEARVYVACLKVGPAAVQRIADQADIKRVTAYVILESLVGLGLVSQSVKGKKTFFTAETPETLARLVSKREAELATQKASLAQVLPELARLKTVPKDLPEVRFYDGADAVRSLLTDFFAGYRGDATQMYAITNADQLGEFFPERAAGSTSSSRVRRRIKSHLVYTSTRGAIYHDSDKANHRISRYIPPEKYDFSGDMSIIGDYVIMISLTGGHPLAVSIHSAEMAKGMRAVFAMAWDLAGQYNR